MLCSDTEPKTNPVVSCGRIYTSSRQLPEQKHWHFGASASAQGWESPDVHKALGLALPFTFADWQNNNPSAGSVLQIA